MFFHFCWPNTLYDHLGELNNTLQMGPYSCDEYRICMIIAKTHRFNV